ncbi:hypothetical protein Sjap_002401 [Stephania japonica]|uniref:Uncharacterized protein n=1 Tax=Stephania japonica TaxID=461633 RepID=A0AAP0KM10_9MAGN
MEPAKIDWKNVRSRFVEDEIYERINAPKWFDFSDPDKSVEDEEAWFCTPHCRHPKTAEDFVKSAPAASSSSSSSSKMKHLRSLSVSEIFARGGDRASSVKRVALKNVEKPSKEVHLRTPERFGRNQENSNPNVSITTQGHGSNYLKSPAGLAAKPKLKSTLSASNLFAGRFDPIKEFCSELKKLVIGAKARENAKMDEENVQLVSGGISDECSQGSDEYERGNKGLLEVEVEKEISGAMQESGEGEKHGKESCGDSNESTMENNEPLLEIKKDNSNTMQKKKKEHRRMNDEIENIPENLREMESREENTRIDRTPPTPQCFSNSKMPPRPMKTSTPLKPCRSKPKFLRKGVFFDK